MPNVFSRRKGRSEEPYIRPSLLHLTSSEESIASDATAPNNPGPGRNVGVLFDAIGGKIERVVNVIAGRYKAGSKMTTEVALIEPDESHELSRTNSIASDATARNNPGPGRVIGLLFDAGGSKIERYLNKAAGRYRLGPQAIFEEIQERSHVLYEREYNLTGIRMQLWHTDNERVILEKKCRKLLKYCRSPVLATQLEALEAVTTLAVQYPPIRQILAGVMQQSHLIPTYKERELHVGYCKALVSVKETQIYNFVKRLEHTSERIRCNEISEDNPDFKLLIHQLNSHLRDSDVSFLIGRLLRLDDSIVSPAVYKSFTSFASMSPQAVEWDALKKVVFFTEECGERYFDGAHVLLKLAHCFPVMKLNEVTDAFSIRFDQSERMFHVDLDEIVDHSSRIVWLLNLLSGSSDLATQLQYLRTLDEGKKNLFRETVFANELLVAYAHIAQYRHASIERIQTFSNRILVAAGSFLEHFDSEDIYQHILAHEAICGSLVSTRYFRSAMAQYGESFHIEPLFMYTDGHIFKPRRAFWTNVECELPYGNVLHDDDVLCTAFEADSDDLFGYTWLEVDGNDGSFSADGHFPVLAGYDATGKELYVATVESAAEPHVTDIYTYVPDGTRSLSIADRNGEVRVCTRFQVMVLQYDPCGVIECTIPDGAKLQTGYMYWIGEEEGIRFHGVSRLLSPLEFSESWVRFEAHYGVRIGVPKEEYVEKNLEAVKDDQDNLLEDVAEILWGDSTEQAVDALVTYEGVDSNVQENSNVEGETGLWERNTSFIEEVQEESQSRREWDHCWNCNAGRRRAIRS